MHSFLTHAKNQRRSKMKHCIGDTHRKLDARGVYIIKIYHIYISKIYHIYISKIYHIYIYQKHIAYICKYQKYITGNLVHTAIAMNVGEAEADVVPVGDSVGGGGHLVDAYVV